MMPQLSDRQQRLLSLYYQAIKGSSAEASSPTSYKKLKRAAKASEHETDVALCILERLDTENIRLRLEVIARAKNND